MIFRKDQDKDLDVSDLVNECSEYDLTHSEIAGLLSTADGTKRLLKLIDEVYESNNEKALNNIIRIFTGANTWFFILPAAFLIRTIKFVLSYHSQAIERAKSNTKTQNLDRMLFIVSFFVSHKDREILLGDLEESYNRLTKRFGKEKALKIIKVDIAKTISAIIYDHAKNIFIKTLKLLGFYKIFKSVMEYFGISIV